MGNLHCTTHQMLYIITLILHQQNDAGIIIPYKSERLVSLQQVRTKQDRNPRPSHSKSKKAQDFSSVSLQTRGSNTVKLWTRKDKPCILCEGNYFPYQEMKGRRWEEKTRKRKHGFALRDDRVILKSWNFKTDKLGKYFSHYKRHVYLIGKVIFLGYFK